MFLISCVEFAGIRFHDLLEGQRRVATHPINDVSALREVRVFGALLAEYGFLRIRNIRRVGVATRIETRFAETARSCHDRRWERNGAFGHGLVEWIRLFRRRER